MSNLLFPTLPGLTWNNKYTDEFFNLIAKASSPGYETRVSLGPDPIIHFELEYSYLRQKTGWATVDELAILRGFFRARQGDFDSFLVYMPFLTKSLLDGTVVGEVLTTDANFIAPVTVEKEGYFENIYEVAGVNGDPFGTPPFPPGSTVYEDGTPLVAGTDYSFVGPGFSLAGITYPGLAIQFVADPTGHVITADFSWYYRVRFEQGTQEFDAFVALLYSAQKVQLVTTRTQ